jgi:hypothetical protein
MRMAGLITEYFREAYLVGAATHVMTLEGVDRFWSEYVVGGPINPKTERPYGSETKAFRDWAKEQGKPVLSDEQYALVCQLYNAVKAHAVAAELLREGIAEGVLRTDYNGIQCQARLDWFSPAHGIVDLKTCEDLSNFASDAMRYKYANQMAFYRSAYCLASGIADVNQVPVFLIAVEKREPYRCGVWNVCHFLLEKSQADNEEYMRQLAVSRCNNVWPTNYEGLRTLAA